jgi:hypothetical protein
MLCAIHVHKMPNPHGQILKVNYSVAGDFWCRVESHTRGVGTVVGVGIHAAENQHCMMLTSTLVFALLRINPESHHRSIESLFAAVCIFPHLDLKVFQHRRHSLFEGFKHICPLLSLLLKSRVEPLELHFPGAKLLLNLIGRTVGDRAWEARSQIPSVGRPCYVSSRSDS